MTWGKTKSVIITIMSLISVMKITIIMGKVGMMKVILMDLMENDRVNYLNSDEGFKMLIISKISKVLMILTQMTMMRMMELKMDLKITILLIKKKRTKQ